MLPSNLVQIDSEQLCHFEAHSQNCKKQLFTSPCLTLCPSKWHNSALKWQIFTKF